MAVPKKRTSLSKKKMRAANYKGKFIIRSNIVQDDETGEIKLSHCATPDGWYKGRYYGKKKNAPAEENSSAEDNGGAN
jgi:ribosomal protein L32